MPVTLFGEGRRRAGKSKSPFLIMSAEVRGGGGVKAGGEVIYYLEETRPEGWGWKEGRGHFRHSPLFLW